MFSILGTGAVQRISEELRLYDLAQMRGTEAVLSRIPDNVGGVYAWYRRFELRDAEMTDPEAFSTYVMNELKKAHSAPRETRLSPSHRVRLAADTVFHKEGELKELASSASFRNLFLTLLNNSILFQQPLYIGKAANLQSRIRTHLRIGSILRIRLNAAGHNIDQSRLLLFLMPNDLEALSPANDNEDEEQPEVEFSEIPSEQLVEDILSRLFLPTFTLRYG